MFEDLISISGLSLDRLHSFLAFAAAKSIIAAAKGNTVRQSLISRQIRELEQFFGTELVRRKGRGLTLTEPGIRLAAMAREQFTALSDLAREAREMPVTLRIVAPNSLAVWFLLPRAAQIRERLPR